MKKILIVEDEIIIALDVARRLSKLGYLITETATTPQQALDSIKQEIPDLILMDINLKADIDGIQLAADIKEHYNIPVIYMTSYSDSAMIERAMYTEPYGYIIKPYSEGVLFATLKTSFTRLELEATTLHQNGLLNNIMNSITDALALIDYKGLIETANESFFKIFGINSDDMDSASEEFLMMLSLEDIKRLHEDGDQEVFDISVDGAGKQILVSTSDCMGESGKRILLTITDLTEMNSVKTALSEAELRFTKIFRKKMVPAVLVSCGDMQIFEMNDAIVQLYKKDREKDKNFADIVGADTIEQIKTVMDGDKAFRLDMVKQSDSDGREFYANFRGKGVDLDGVNYMLVDVYDVTEQVRISQMEKEMQQKLIHANKMTSLGTLVSGVAHEINNPNNFIMFNSSLLTDFWKDIFNFLEMKGHKKISDMTIAEFKNDVDNLMNGIVNGSERIRNIVMDLKGFAKSESGEAFSRVDIGQVVKTAVRILEHQISKSTDNFVIEIKGSPLYAKGNQQKLEQVFINILMNALEALQRKDALVSVFCRCEGDNIIVEFQDEGIGIPQESLDRVTEPFFTTRQNCGGTGLGLSIAYTILKEHQGSLSIDSTIGKGTVVTIKIPADNQ